MAGAYWEFDPLMDAYPAEATALLKGLHLIETLGWSPVIIETDSLKVSKARVGETDVLGPNAEIMMKSFHTHSVS